MPYTSQGSLEVDQTLRLARDAIELDIARYRILVFASVTVLTGVLALMGLSTTWIPTFVFGGLFVYSCVLRVYLGRYGNPAGLAALALTVDLITTVLAFHLTRRWADSTALDRANGAFFVMYIVGPALMLSLLINALRNSTRLAVLGGVVALACFASTAPVLVGFHPAQISVGLILAIAAVIGWAAAVQARKNLDSFARLQLLRRYLPPEAVDRIMRDDPDAALALGGRLVTVTLLAADLRGFTTMAEKLTPGEVMAQLNAYHGAMVDVIERHGGAIDKFIGDGTLVVFGLDGSTSEAAAKAVDCAAAMLEALVVHNQERANAGALPLAMGIAVHTGPVIAGNLGVPGRRLEFTVIGDAVNTVSRLEGQTKSSGTPVLVSADTAAVLPSTGALRELPPVSLRGKGQELRVFGLTAVPTIRPPA